MTGNCASMHENTCTSPVFPVISHYGFTGWQKRHLHEADSSSILRRLSVQSRPGGAGRDIKTIYSANIG
ncbi:MAG: hypothetical protein KAR42_09265 [candidate division Zixibacteria bacterium]|nr:hypothetical protein [candidate division Zixibacteria bacterium]